MDKINIKDKPKISVGDTAHTLMRAGVSAIPLIGGSAVELLSAIITPPLTKRRDEWVQSISEGLKELEEKVDNFKIENLSNNDIFITIVMHATQLAVRNHQKEKLDALRNAVLNTALASTPEEDMKLMFLNFIDTLTPWHIRILKFFDNPIEWGKNNDIIYSTWPMGGPSSVLEHAFPELKGRREFYGQFIRDLYNRGLMNMDSDGLGVTMSAQGMFTSRTTATGKNFIDFISFPIKNE